MVIGVLGAYNAMKTTLVRIVSGIGMGLFVCVSIFHDNTLLTLLAFMIFSLSSLWEFYILTERSKQERAFSKIGISYSILIILCYYAQFLHQKQQSGHSMIEYNEYYRVFIDLFYPASSNLSLIFILLIMTAALTHMLHRSPQAMIYSVSITVFGVLYTVVTMCYGFLIYAFPDGQFYLFLFLVLPVSADSGAYFAGMALGKHRTKMAMSPNKTYEGYIGGLICTCVTGLIALWVGRNFSDYDLNVSYAEIFLVSVVIAVFSFIGDLMESCIKRDVAKKDSSSIIPGHGGILDVLDAVYWSLPIGYLYLFIRNMQIS